MKCNASLLFHCLLRPTDSESEQATSSNLIEPHQTLTNYSLLMLYSSLKRFRRVEQHSNLAEPLYSLIKEQRERSNQGSTLFEPL